MDMKKVERHKAEYSSLTDGELLAQMHQWVEHSDMHLAAKLLLNERKTKQERKRFHFIFWPSLIAALAGVVSLFL